ncbi:MAG TPA: protein-glutamine glutaminase family protein [Flavisolibacter sp.]|jgi:hypothetical protein
MEQQEPATLFDASLADDLPGELSVTKSQAEQIFHYFKNAGLFRWKEANNDCEDRANAICILLDSWGIVNCKAWVFSGYFRRKGFGSLTNRWNYHVAAALPVQEENGLVYYVIDPATCSQLTTLDRWALQVTESDTSYHFIKHSDYYIFPGKKINKDNWYKRNKRNYNWTMQGLGGINGASSKGKAQLAFHKKAVKQTEKSFIALKNQRVVF